MNGPRDRYDEDIEAILTAGEDRKELVLNFWSSASALFDFAGPTTVYCGCLTQVRSGEYPAVTPMLTELIRADERLPIEVDGSEDEATLNVFAQWQRAIDAMGLRSKSHLDERAALVDSLLRTGVAIARMRGAP